jgi:hypothetical protein
VMSSIAHPYNGQAYDAYSQPVQSVSTMAPTTTTTTTAYNGQSYGGYLQPSPIGEGPVGYTQIISTPVSHSHALTPPQALRPWPGAPQENIPLWSQQQTQPSTIASTPVIPPRPSDYSTNTSNYGRQEQQQILQKLQHELSMQQGLIPNNPQYIPSSYPQDPHSTALRGPQGAGEPVYATSNQDIQAQIAALQAELNRRQAAV